MEESRRKERKKIKMEGGKGGKEGGGKHAR